MHELRVAASDGWSTAERDVTVTVTDADESDVGAVGDLDPAPSELAEDADVDDAVGYSLADDADGLFAIGAASGVVTLAGTLDAEIATSHDIVARATSTDGSISERAFAIAVTDVDEADAGPVSDADLAADELSEDAFVGSSAGITASAEDADIDDSVSYSLMNDADGLFSIDETSGVVTLAGALDVEAATSHDIVVRVTSTDGSFSERGFTIAVTDVDEADVGPLTDADSMADELAEDAAIGSSAGVTTSADDGDVDDSVTYSLMVDANGLFAIDGANGRVTLAGALDAEKMTSHEIVVLATSTDGSVSERAFAIAVTDVDEADVGPVDDVDPSASVLAEDASVGSSAGITASAGDTDVDDSVAHSLADDADGLFSIGATSGVVTLAGALDAEPETSHDIVVRATSSDGSVSERAFTIAVADVDEADVGPVDDVDPAASVLAENAAIGTAAGITAAAEDADIGDSILYELVDDAGGRFAIDGASGSVTLAGALDAETSTSHEITVRATSTDGSTSERAFAIALTDVDEADVGPVNDIDPTASALPEDAAIGTAAGVTASAEDADVDDPVSYELVDDANGRFAIDAASGLVTLAGALDAETATSHDVVVRATSGDGSVSEASFAIVVDDVDEAPTLADARFETVVGYAGPIGTLEAVDPDSGDVLVFELLSTGTASGLGVELAADGAVRVEASAPGEHVLDVRVVDAGGASATGTLTIGIGPASAEPPLTEAEPVAPEPAAPAPVDPAPAEPEPAEPEPAAPAPVDPAPAEPEPAEPEPTEPTPVDPTPAEPEPAEPEPAEPEPAEPEPAEPEPAEPELAEPELAAASPTEPEPESPAPRPSLLAPPSSAPAVPGGMGSPATAPLAGVPSGSEGPVPSAPNVPHAAEPGDPGPGERVAASRERIGGVVGDASAESRPVRIAASVALVPWLGTGAGAVREGASALPDASVEGLPAGRRLVLELLLDAGEEAVDDVRSGASVFEALGAPGTLSAPLIRALELLRSDADVAEESEEARATLVAAAAAVTGGTLTVGFVTWLLRSGLLLAAAATTTPLWRGFDPVPILAATRRSENDGNDGPPPAERGR